MDSNSKNFSIICGDLCNILYLREYDKAKVNALIDELNAKPYKSENFVMIHDATTLITALYLNIKPSDNFLTAKTSHLLQSIITKQNLQFSNDTLWKVISWHMRCIKECSDMILPDILHGVQCILQFNPSVASQFTAELVGEHSKLVNLTDLDKNTLQNQNDLEITLLSLKCICSITCMSDDKVEHTALPIEDKDRLSRLVVKFLLKGPLKVFDDFAYYKVVIQALRLLSNLYLNETSMNIPLPEVIGICKYYILLGLMNDRVKPEKIMPSQQTIALIPVINNSKGGKKQKMRKQRNNAIESLKKDIPITDSSLMKDVGNFDNHFAYKPVSQQYFDTQKVKSNLWALTSDSDMSDVEYGREAKLVALKARVRQTASYLLLVLVKVTDKKNMFGYWHALFPDSPDAVKWLNDENSKKTLAYCAVSDPISSSRSSVLCVILALLSGSKMYLSQAEICKKETASFIPFSVSLGYMIQCMHRVLVSILDNERVKSVVLAALKCCAALVQATPYHKMNDGLISEVVRATRKFLVHRDITLQVGALITMGCVLSIDPKTEEIFKSIQKDSTIKVENNSFLSKSIKDNNECDGFEEGYSDDEIFSADDEINTDEIIPTVTCFNSWVMDICFRNMGWTFRNENVVKCTPSAIPVILESLQILSAIAFHYYSELMQPHIALLADFLYEMLQHEHQDVVLQAAKTVSMIGDAVQKLDQSQPLNQSVYMWEKLLKPLSSVLQTSENASVKAVVCDCIANIGENTFKELPGRLQVLCCTLLVGSTSDEEANVRAAAVRALAMTVMYRTLREDICFVTDCGENILRALSEPSLVVRTKASWALGNLSDALVLNMEEPDIEDMDDDLLYRLLEVSVQCACDNDKVKMSAMRGLGNLLRLIKEENLQRNPKLKPLCESAIQKLIDCACKVTNMKVRWNACYAMGNAMKNDNLFHCFSGWQGTVLSNLCSLSQECKNLKVRINAAVALRLRTRINYGEHFATVWRGVMAAMENAANVDDFTEYKHKDNLLEQLTVTLAHMCCLLKQTDLPDLLDPLVFHYDCAKSILSQLCHKLPPENPSCLNILEAAKYLTVELTATSNTQQQSLSMLQEIFIWDI